jgi:hypothetical protein
MEDYLADVALKKMAHLSAMLWQEEQRICAKAPGAPTKTTAMIITTLCVVMPLLMLRGNRGDAERPGMHAHAERGNDLQNIQR